MIKSIEFKLYELMDEDGEQEEVYHSYDVEYDEMDIARFIGREDIISIECIKKLLEYDEEILTNSIEFEDYLMEAYRGYAIEDYIKKYGDNSHTII